MKLFTAVAAIPLFSASSSGFSAYTTARNGVSTVTRTTLLRSSATNDTNDSTKKSSEEKKQKDISSLPLPPSQGMNLYRNIRDSISYISNPDRFVATRAAKLGPVFMAYNFFKLTVFCGGQEAVKEFISGAERQNKVTHPALPESFVDLHTKWGALNMDISEPMFKEARVLFGDVLSSREALEQYSQVAEKEIQDYVNQLAERVKKEPNQPIYLAPELKSLCLQLFSKKFSGQGLTKEQEQQFIDYNAALLSLTKNSIQYRKGEDALKNLRIEMIRRFRTLDDPSLPADTPGKWYHDQVYGRENFDNEERISTGMILFIWGAYVESASLMVESLALAQENGIDLNHVRKEYLDRDSSEVETDPTFWNEKSMPYTTGILRETLRTAPPGAGVPRFSYQDFELAGFRIPSETPVMLDPRIGNKDPNLYVDPENFEPLRWVPQKEATSSSSCPFQGTALKLGQGSWFPGGFGSHQCPGVPLAELVSRMFLSKMAATFDSWSYHGDGLTKEGEIEYETIPVRIPPDTFGMLFKLKDEIVTPSSPPL